MKNVEVARCWYNGITARAGHLRTDGINLWSYNLLIATVKNGNRVVYDYTTRGGHFYSVTTSKHVGMAARFGNVVSPE
jgi:hypothetical protein